MTPLRTLPFALFLVAIGACKPTWSITLGDGSTAMATTFSLTRAGSAEPASISVFRVDACTARGTPPIDTHWLTVAPGDPQPVSRIAYGTSPTGWRTAQGPHPLTPGCYRAAVTGAPPLEFDVLPDGRVMARR